MTMRVSRRILRTQQAAPQTRPLAQPALGTHLGHGQTKLFGSSDADPNDGATPRNTTADALRTLGQIWPMIRCRPRSTLIPRQNRSAHGGTSSEWDGGTSPAPDTAAPSPLLLSSPSRLRSRPSALVAVLVPVRQPVGLALSLLLSPPLLPLLPCSPSVVCGYSEMYPTCDRLGVGVGNR